MKDFSTTLQNRTRELAVASLQLLKSLPMEAVNKVFVYQLSKSVSSVAANYRASRRARSKKEFYAKLCIVVEEADETVYWLEMVQELNPQLKGKIEPLTKEATEILKIFSKSKSTARANLST